MSQNNLNNNQKLCIYLYDRINISLSSILKDQDNHKSIFYKLEEIMNHPNDFNKQKNEIKKKYDQDSKKITKEINEIHKKKSKCLSELEKLDKNHNIKRQEVENLNNRKKLGLYITETDLENKIESDHSIKEIKLELKKLNEKFQINIDEIEKRHNFIQKTCKEINENNKNFEFFQKIKFDISEFAKDLRHFNLNVVKLYKNLTDDQNKFAEQIHDKMQSIQKKVLKEYEEDEINRAMQEECSKTFYPTIYLIEWSQQFDFLAEHLARNPNLISDAKNRGDKTSLIIHYDPNDKDSDSEADHDPVQIQRDFNNYYTVGLNESICQTISNIIDNSIVLDNKKNINTHHLNACNKKNNELKELIISKEKELLAMTNKLREIFLKQEKEKIDTELKEIENSILLTKEKIINNSNELKTCTEDLDRSQVSLSKMTEQYEKEINTLEESKMTQEDLINQIKEIEQLFISTISNDFLSETFDCTNSNNYNALYYKASFNPSTYYILIFDLIPLKKDDTMHLTEENIKCIKFMHNILNKEKEVKFDIDKFFEQFIIPAYENILLKLKNESKIQKPNNIKFFNINNLDLSAKVYEIISYQESRQAIKNTKEMQKMARLKDQTLKDIISGKKNLLYDIYEINNQMDILERRKIKINKYIESYELTDEDFLKFLDNTCTLQVKNEHESVLKTKEDYEAIIKESPQNQKISECLKWKTNLENLDVKERLKIVSNRKHLLSIFDNINIILSIICLEDHVFISKLNFFLKNLQAYNCIFDNEFLMINDNKYNADKYNDDKDNNETLMNISNNSYCDIQKLSQFYEQISKLPSVSTINKIYTKNSKKTKKILLLCVSYFLKNYKKFLEFRIELEVILDHGLIFMNNKEEFKEEQFNVILFDRLNEKFSKFLDKKIDLYIIHSQEKKMLESNSLRSKKKLNKSKDDMTHNYYTYIDEIYNFFTNNWEFTLPIPSDIAPNNSDKKPVNECKELSDLLNLDTIFDNLNLEAPQLIKT